MYICLAVVHNAEILGVYAEKKYNIIVFGIGSYQIALDIIHIWNHQKDKDV